MIVNTQHLKFWERVHLRQIVRAQYGCTVRQAREHCSPTGWALLWTTVGATLLALSAGLIFTPIFLLLALTIPVGMPLKARMDRARWLAILPPERDDEVVELA